MMTYTKQPNGDFIRRGQARSRYVYVQGKRSDGTWSDPLIPIRRTQIMEVIERAIREGGKHLPCRIYRLTEVPSTLTPEARQRLKALRDKRRER